MPASRRKRWGFTEPVVKFLATGGYSGYAPWAPGTWGSGVGLGLFLCLGSLPVWLYGLVLTGAIALGVWVAYEAERLFASTDPGCIVIDEIVGMLVTYFAIPTAVLPLLLGFVCFRLFDIYKPFPLPQLERLPGGWGVMLDDVGAGVLAQACLRLFLLW